MAIALDTATNGGSGASPYSFNHTVTGSNTILFVATMNAVGADVVTGITYNGVAMTKILDATVPTNRNIDLWYLINPATGTNAVVVTFTGGGSVWPGAISYTGAAQTGQPDASTSSTGSSVTSLTETLTTVADNCWIVAVFGVNAFVPTAGTNAVARSTAINGAQMFDTNGAQTPAGSHSIQALVTSGNMAGVAASFSPVASAPATTPARRRVFKHH